VAGAKRGERAFRVHDRAPATPSLNLRSDWRDVIVTTARAFNADHLSIVGAGVAFHILLALLPAMAAFVALYGLVADVHDLPRQMRLLAIVVPADVVSFMGAEMIRIATARSGLSVAVAAGSAVALWSANGATQAMFTGLNIAYEARERRDFVRLTIVTGAFTIGFLVFLVLAVALLGFGGAVGALFGRAAQALFDIARWPLIIAAFAGGLTLLYRFGPCRPGSGRLRLEAGTVLVTLIWIAASAALSFYLGRFAHYGRTYGALGAAVGLMTWLWLSAVIVLAGAELNAEIARRAARLS
jgi:membrane protein